MLTEPPTSEPTHYHEPTDTLPTLDPTIMQRVAEVVVAAVRDVAGQPSS